MTRRIKILKHYSFHYLDGYDGDDNHAQITTKSSDWIEVDEETFKLLNSPSVASKIYPSTYSSDGQYIRISILEDIKKEDEIEFILRRVKEISKEEEEKRIKREKEVARAKEAREKIKLRKEKNRIERAKAILKEAGEL